MIFQIISKLIKKYLDNKNININFAIWKSRYVKIARDMVR